MYLDLARIGSAITRWSPYPYFVVVGALFADAGIEAANAFPRVGRLGAVAVEQTSYGPPFEQLLQELRGERFRNILAEKLDIDLEGKSTVITVRGKTRVTDGNIHTDKPSKLVTVLLYFNEPHQASVSGLRILNGPRSIDDFVEEIPPLLGTMVAFKVTPNGWHGHRPFVGERHSLQLNYLSGVRTTGKHQFARRLVGHLRRRLAEG
ncbi:MAG: 2OG-Fe(II) oxygenase [Sphingomicrobium sp.]